MARSPNSISAELLRNRIHGSYDPQKAHAKAARSLRYRRFQWRKIHQREDLRAYIIAGLQKHWNPDEISGKMKEEHQPFCVSKTAIYAWLYSARGQRYCSLLYSRRFHPKKRKRTQASRGIPARRSITLRPTGATHRSHYGHWEGDAIVSGRTGTGAVAVGYERKSRLIVARLVRSLSPKPFARTLERMTVDCTVKTWSLDNGIENRDHLSLSAPAFFCDPYASWQKGGVENANKMLRRYLPKGTNFATVSPSRLAEIVDRINHKPRKILGYKTAHEVAWAAGVLRSSFTKCPD
jgi:IS30 family transposase